MLNSTYALREKKRESAEGGQSPHCAKCSSSGTRTAGTSSTEENLFHKRGEKNVKKKVVSRCWIWKFSCRSYIVLPCHRLLSIPDKTSWIISHLNNGPRNVYRVSYRSNTSPHHPFISGYDNDGTSTTHLTSDRTWRPLIETTWSTHLTRTKPSNNNLSTAQYFSSGLYKHLWKYHIPQHVNAETGNAAFQCISRLFVTKWVSTVLNIRYSKESTDIGWLAAATASGCFVFLLNIRAKSAWTSL